MSLKALMKMVVFVNSLILEILTQTFVCFNNGKINQDYEMVYEILLLPHKQSAISSILPTEINIYFE